MAEPFVAEIRIFPFNFAPNGWAQCDGELLPISQNTALFSLLGTVYGGDGVTNFALPNLQGRAPMQPGQGPGLSLYDLGETGGLEIVTLRTPEIPAHAHGVQAANTPANSRSPEDRSLARSIGAHAYSGQNPAGDVRLADSALTEAGASQPHNNMQPYLTVNFCIALQGIYPPRS